MSDRIRRRVIIRGRVQGVGFRFATQRKAHELGVDGWVCNRPDGSVEATFEGPAEQVAAMLAWARQGPPASRVDRVDRVDAVDGQAEPSRGLAGFVVAPPDPDRA